MRDWYCRLDRLLVEFANRWKKVIGQRRQVSEPANWCHYAQGKPGQRHAVFDYVIEFV
jgi:hypothetical protein